MTRHRKAGLHCGSPEGADESPEPDPDDQEQEIDPISLVGNLSNTWESVQAKEFLSDTSEKVL